MSQYKVDPNAKTRQIVGQLDLAKINGLLGTGFTGSGEVIMYPGLKKHMEKSSHAEIFDTYHSYLPAIIACPDYIGRHPKVADSMELYKVLADTILLAVHFNGEYYVASFYDLDNASVKIQKRLNSGRIVPYS